MQGWRWYCRSFVLADAATSAILAPSASPAVLAEPLKTHPQKFHSQSRVHNFRALPSASSSSDDGVYPVPRPLLPILNSSARIQDY